MAKVRAEQLAEALGIELEEYAGEVCEKMKKAVQTAAKECQKDVRRRSPARTGKYKHGWRTFVAYDGPGGTRVIVHNKTDGPLTHLLEYGHVKTNGGRVEGKPHIRPAEEAMERNLMRELKKELSQ